MRYRIFFAFIMISVSLISGCTTMKLFDAHKESGSLYREINRTQHFHHISYYRSNFIGYTEQNGYQYARILIHNPRSCLTQDHQIEMLLPLTPDKAARPLLIESDEPINNNGNPVNIVGDSYPQSKVGEILDKEKWAGFPATIFANSPSLSHVSYRIGPELSDRREDKTVDNLNWVCRSYVEHNILLTFLPITVAIDIISSPVQFIVFHFNLIRLN